jgi:POT family proton-dependent oligopeptide transporter
MADMLAKNRKGYPKSFWVIWGVEFWERFGYYGTQAILALYFVKHLGYSDQESFYIFGSFAAFVYGFVWIGGWIGDKYIGAKRTLLIGAIILMISYLSLGIADQDTIFYALGGIVVGNALFKANPSSLVSKIYNDDVQGLDAAMTVYYMAINIGSFVSMSITPIIADKFGWHWAFISCGLGLFLGILNYLVFYKHLANLSSAAGRNAMKWSKVVYVVIASVFAMLIIGYILPHSTVCTILIVIVVTIGFIYYIATALSLKGKDRIRMFVGFILILEAIIFFVLYFQMPMSLTFLALHNVDRVVLGFTIPAASYQVLNPIVIVVMSPLLAWFYHKHSSTHVTKFCLGMTLCAIAFIILWIPQFIDGDGIISSWWMVATYWLQSTGELLISALGLAMVAELCPKAISGIVMGIWFLTSMLAGPIAGWLSALTAPSPELAKTITPAQGLSMYGNVFGIIGLVTLVIAVIMWITRPWLNKFIEKEHIVEDKTIEIMEPPHV